MELYALCWTYGSVVRASVQGLLGTLIGDLFWRRGIPCCFGPFVFLLMETIFSFNFGFIFGVKLWLRVWSQNLSFVEFVADYFRLACVGSGRMRAEWVVPALRWFYKHDSGS